MPPVPAVLDSPDGAHFHHDRGAALDTARISSVQFSRSVMSNSATP